MWLLLFFHARARVASYADLPLARHAIFPPQRGNIGEEILRDESKVGLRRRLVKGMRSYSNVFSDKDDKTGGTVSQHWYGTLKNYHSVLFSVNPTVIILRL